ncbi:MAG: 3-oxo-tetronate 4-phosphate decarboxylase [Kiloniellales bacterium]
MKEARLREDMVRLSHSLFERGFSVGSAGNVSAVVDDGLLVTPTDSSLGALDPARISKVNKDGRHLSGDRPSKEMFLHRALYETRSGAGAVVHLHSTYATALSCLEDLEEDDCIPPLTPYVVMRVGRVKLLPYVRPGNPRLGELIRALGGRYAAVLLANHGPVIAGKDLASTIYAAEELEEGAKLFVLLQSLKVRTLTEEQVEELRRVFG